MRPEDITLYGPPNPALTAIFNGNQLRAICLAEAQRAKAIYISVVARGDDPRYAADRLHESAAAFTEKVAVGIGTRWAGVMEVTSGHVLPHTFGWEDDGEDPEEHPGSADFNTVLELL